MRGIDARLEHELAQAFFDLRSCGLVLMDRTGAIVTANVMVRVLAGSRLSASRRRCCGLFGCKDPDGPLDGRCLTQATLTDGPQRNVAARLHTANGRSSAILSTTLIGDDHVLVEIQIPAARRGFRSRTPAGLLTASMLGPTRLEDEHGSIGRSWLGNRPGQLLKYLIARRNRVVPADEIAEALWTNAGPLGAHSVRQCVYELRGRVDPDRSRRASSSLIIGHRGGYSIDRRRIQVDCDTFESRIDQGMAAFHSGEHGLAEQDLATGMDLYRGEFLADEPYAHWALDERTRLAGMAGEALRALAVIAARRHDYDGAARHLERLTALDGYDVDVQRALIELCVARGRRSEAKRRYTSLCSRLRHDFGEEPGFDLSEVSMRRGAFAELIAV